MHFWRMSPSEVRELPLPLYHTMVAYMAKRIKQQGQQD